MRGLAALLIVACGAARPAAAEEPVRDDYTGTIVVADLLSVGAAFGGGVLFAHSWGGDCDTCEENTSGVFAGGALVVGGLAGYLAAAPAIHQRERGATATLRSVGLRLAIPAIGVAATGDFAFVGAIAGMVVAPLVDWAWTAFAGSD
jgi:hypothetical protein